MRAITFGIAGIAVAPLFLVGAAGFVGPFEPNGWKLGGTLVAVAHIAWSIWLLAVGVGLIAA